MNRLIRAEAWGWSLEADPTHAELLVEELDIEKGLATPGVEETDPEDEKPLDEVGATRYRSLVARAKYLATDRLDTCFAVKELCKTMSKHRCQLEQVDASGKISEEKSTSATQLRAPRTCRGVGRVFRCEEGRMQHPSEVNARRSDPPRRAFDQTVEPKSKCDCPQHRGIRIPCYRESCC